MEKEYRVVLIDPPALSEVWGSIGEALTGYNHQQVGDDNSQRICFALTAPGGEIAGGVIGIVYWDWLYIDLMWIKEGLRGHGFGHQLLLRLEEEACRRGVKHAHLDTFSFQAPDFYIRHGYRVFGELADFPAGQTRYFLTKDFTENPIL